MKYLYRYRSLKSKHIYKELENLEIYFAKPDELNDQMEDYMNIFWQGDEIAFKGLFKHYLYTLSSVYYEACYRNRNVKINTEFLPVFLSDDGSKRPEFDTTFKEIYYEFFNSEEIANIPSKMAQYNKKFTEDELLLILNTIHLYAYLVIDSIFKKNDSNIEVFKNKENKEIYQGAKYGAKYSKTVDNLNNEKLSQEEILNQIYRLDIERTLNKKVINNVYSDKDTYNVNILAFDFPQFYIKCLKKLLYENHYIACFTDDYQNEPMWGHYANGGNGICLRFKTNYNKFDILSSLTADSYIKIDINKVIYSDEYPEIDFFGLLGRLPYDIIKNFWLCNYDRTQFSQCMNKYNNSEQWWDSYHKLATEYICTKSKNWISENEYRIYIRDQLSLHTEQQGIIAKYKFEDLDAIIFGRKVSKADKQKIINIMLNHCKNRNRKDFKFYDLYYSTITKKLELKNCSELILMQPINLIK